MSTSPRTLRVGCLGAARIVPAALARPAARLDGVELAAIAARDPARARQAAKKLHIPTVHESYEDLLADDSLDAVYIPLPNGLHGQWMLKAIAAGRHVLCEKPFTADAAEAAEVRDRAADSGLVVMEAFHWRYHPLAERMLAIVRSGELGTISRIESTMAFPVHHRDDIRWKLDLAGGATMDAGCYPVSVVRALAGAEPAVVSAKALLRSPEIDRTMEAELSFADGRSGRIFCSMWSAHVVGFSATVIGDDATLQVFNPFSPHVFHRLTVRGHGARRVEHVRDMSTYAHQLAAFAAAVHDGTPVPTDATDAVANMQVIDDIYRAAGLQPRTPTGSTR